MDKSPPSPNFAYELSLKSKVLVELSQKADVIPLEEPTNSTSSLKVDKPAVNLVVSKVSAVATPANTALPSPVIVAPIPAPKAPLPTLKQVLEVTIPTNSALPELNTVAPAPA